VPRKREEQVPTFEVWRLKRHLLGRGLPEGELIRQLMGVGRSDYDRARLGTVLAEDIVDLQAHWRAKFAPQEQHEADYRTAVVMAAIERKGVWIGDGIAVLRRVWKRPQRHDKGLKVGAQ